LVPIPRMPNPVAAIPVKSFSKKPRLEAFKNVNISVHVSVARFYHELPTPESPETISVLTSIHWLLC
jgi:hypothetical protein